jgi:hypothetical protein
MSKGKLACTLPWREIEGAANKKTKMKCSRLCAYFQAITATEKKKRQPKMLVCRLVSPLLINYRTSL